MFIEFFISLIGTYFDSGMAEYWLFPALALSFVALVPVIVRKFFIWG